MANINKGMTARERRQKADFSLSDLNTAGLLNTEQSNTFIRTLIDSPTMINVARVVPMNSPRAEINKMKFGTRILQNGENYQSGGPNDNGNPPNDRYLTEAKRSKPTTSKVTLTTKEVIAEVRLPYETLEDNIEREGFEQTVLERIAERAAVDLEELFILGDTASADDYLAQQDGILKLATAHTVNGGGAAISSTLFNTIKKTMPTQYRRVLRDLRYFAHDDVESDYRLALASRMGALGDQNVSSNTALTPFGVPLTPAALMPTDTVVLTDPQNLILGIQRNIRIETDRDIRSREIIIVLTARVAIQIEETDALVKCTNVGSA